MWNTVVPTLTSPWPWLRAQYAHVVMHFVKSRATKKVLLIFVGILYTYIVYPPFVKVRFKKRVPGIYHLLFDFTKAILSSFEARLKGCIDRQNTIFKEDARNLSPAL